MHPSIHQTNKQTNNPKNFISSLWDLLQVFCLLHTTGPITPTPIPPLPMYLKDNALTYNSCLFHNYENFMELFSHRACYLGQPENTFPRQSHGRGLEASLVSLPLRWQLYLPLQPDLPPTHYSAGIVPKLQCFRIWFSSSVWRKGDINSTGTILQILNWDLALS